VYGAGEKGMPLDLVDHAPLYKLQIGDSVVVILNESYTYVTIASTIGHIQRQYRRKLRRKTIEVDGQKALRIWRVS